VVTPQISHAAAAHMSSNEFSDYAADNVSAGRVGGKQLPLLPRAEHFAKWPDSITIPCGLSSTELLKLCGARYFFGTVSSLPTTRQPRADYLRQAGVNAMSDDQLYVERRPDGRYNVTKPNAKRPSAILPTQKEAIGKARELNPGGKPLVERVRNTSEGGRDKWRPA